MIKVEFDSEKFKEILKSYFTSVRKLCDRSGLTYIGYNERTLYRAIKEETMSKDLYDSIMKVYDISDCVVDFIYPEEEKVREIRRLKDENRMLRNKVKDLKREIKLRDEYESCHYDGY